MDIRSLRNSAAYAAGFSLSQRKQYSRDVSTTFPYPFAEASFAVSELYRHGPRLDCAACDSAIIESARQGPCGSPLLHEYCRLAPDDGAPN